jgi:hypothetical protein
MADIAIGENHRRPSLPAYDVAARGTRVSIELPGGAITER